MLGKRHLKEELILLCVISDREKAKGHSVFCKGHRPLLRGGTVETSCVLSRKLSASPLFSVHQNLFSGSYYKSRAFLANRGLLWIAEGFLLVAVSLVESFPGRMC